MTWREPRPGDHREQRPWHENDQNQMGANETDDAGHRQKMHKPGGVVASEQRGQRENCTGFQIASPDRTAAAPSRSTMM